MQTLAAGQLREKVVFQQRAAARDEFGQAGTAWEDRVTCFADIRELIGRSALEAGVPENLHGVKIAVRGTAKTRAITVTDRVLLRGQSAAVRSVMQRDRHGQIVDVLAFIGGVET